MKPTDFFDAEELRIIDESLVAARLMAEKQAGLEDGTLGIIPILIAAVTTAAQMAQAKIAQTKAMKAQAQAMAQQAAEMRAYAEEQKKIAADVKAAQQAVVEAQVAQIQQQTKATVAYEQAATQTQETVQSMAVPVAVAAGAGVLYFLLKR